MRYGIGPQDAWDLGRHLARVAAHGLRELAQAAGQPNPAAATVDWAGMLVAHAFSLDSWSVHTDDEDSPVILREAQAVMCWIADNLEDLRPSTPPAIPTPAWRAATQRRRHGITDNDCTDLGRALSPVSQHAG
jgi:hypothetical protein